MRYIGKYGPIETEDESYEDGLRTGRSWDRDWQPGGPFVYNHQFYTDKDWKDFCAASRANNTAWQRGFAAGFKELMTSYGTDDP